MSRTRIWPGMLIALILLAIPAIVLAKGGFDAFGYNYQARIFNGRYCDADRVIGGMYCDVSLVMKWSSAWLNKDRVRCAGTPQEGSSACDGSWLTNHQKGSYTENGKSCHWTWFVKIIYPGYKPVDSDTDGLDDATGARILWGSYIVIQSISNDTCAGEHGVQELVKPPGFGAWK